MHQVDSNTRIDNHEEYFTDQLFCVGNVYVADQNNQRIRKVTVSTGIITTIAGTGTTTFSGDNGQATSATVKNPYGVALDSSGRPQCIHVMIFNRYFEFNTINRQRVHR